MDGADKRKRKRGRRARACRAKDLLAGKQPVPSLISVKKGENLISAIRLMRVYGISQLPVTSGGKVVGTISEDLAMERLYQGADAGREKAGDIMADPLPQLDEDQDIAKAYEMFASGVLGILVTRGEMPIGLITRSDLIVFWAFGRAALDF